MQTHTIKYLQIKTLYDVLNSYSFLGLQLPQRRCHFLAVGHLEDLFGPLTGAILGPGSTASSQVAAESARQGTGPIDCLLEGCHDNTQV